MKLLKKLLRLYVATTVKIDEKHLDALMVDQGVSSNDYMKVAEIKAALKVAEADHLIEAAFTMDNTIDASDS